MFLFKSRILTLDKSVYSNFLIKLNADRATAGLNLGAETIPAAYQPAAAAARTNLIINNGWTINDQGAE